MLFMAETTPNVSFECFVSISCTMSEAHVVLEQCSNLIKVHNEIFSVSKTVWVLSFLEFFAIWIQWNFWKRNWSNSHLLGFSNVSFVRQFKKYLFPNSWKQAVSKFFSDLKDHVFSGDVGSNLFEHYWCVFFYVIDL